jgi:pimeloyl-ACP methyl ester carboxylesterase
MEASLRLLLNRDYRQPHRHFVVTTGDGVAIHGVHLGRRGRVALIYCHGFFSSKNYFRVPRFVESLARDFDAIAFDFRGHGDSGGKCTFGREEVRDLRAVVKYARDQGYTTIVAIGASMGGAIVLRYFGRYGDLDGIVTIGAVTDAQRLRPVPARLSLQFFFGTPAGQTLARFIGGARVGDWRPTEQPLDFAHRVHVPLLVIHGEWDPVVEPEQGRRLAERAPEPKELVIVPRGGHVMSLLNEKTRRLIVDWVRREVVGRRGRRLAT